MARKSRTIIARIPEHLFELLDEHRLKTELKQSEILRIAIEHYLDHRATTTEAVLRHVGLLHRDTLLMKDYINDLYSYVMRETKPEQSFEPVLQAWRTTTRLFEERQRDLILALTEGRMKA